MTCVKKKMKRPSWQAWLTVVFLVSPGALVAGGEQVLTVATWGGAYEASQRAAYFEPFTDQTGIEVRTVTYNGGLQVLRDHLAGAEVEWDVIDMIQSDASAACEEGLLETIDPGIVAPAPDGTPPEEDFMEGAPISVIWDGQLIGFNSWAIPKGTDQTALAEQFIGFATRPENMAVQANRISYGPARRSARRRIGLHVDTRVPMRPHMPTAPEHMENAVIRDHRWYSQTVRLREQWFREWLGRNSDLLPEPPSR